MLFITKNKLKANKENDELDMLIDFLTSLTVASFVKEALEDLENNPECLKKMVEIAVSEKLSFEDAITLGFVHGYKHAAIKALTEENE
uniref:hypothetical protein n=1 Tax=Lactococcus garvieae TaxID=1363 RepID=UPI00359C2D4A